MASGLKTKGKILILYSWVGGGHASAAKRVKGLLESRGYQVDTIDLYDDIGQKHFKNMYNFFIGKDISGFKWTILLKLIQLTANITKIYVLWLKSILKKRLVVWNQTYDAVIINIPGAPLLLEAAHTLPIQLKILVHILDFDDIPLSNHELSWSPKKDRWLNERSTLISPSHLCTKTLLSQGIPLIRIAPIHGFPMNLTKEFKEKVQKQHAKTTRDKNTGTSKILVVFGGNGSPVQVKIIRHIIRMEKKLAKPDSFEHARPLEFTFVFGRNKKLLESAQRKVERSHLGDQIKLLGWADNMLDLIFTHDVVIGKPGATSVCESLAIGRPYFTVRNIDTYPQEKASGRFILSNELGLVRKTYAALIRVCYRLDPEHWEHLRGRALELSHKFIQADDEFVQIIEERLKNPDPAQVVWPNPKTPDPLNKAATP